MWKPGDRVSGRQAALAVARELSARCLSQGRALSFASRKSSQRPQRGASLLPVPLEHCRRSRPPWAGFSSLFPSPSPARGETVLFLLLPPAFPTPESASSRTQGWSSPSCPCGRGARKPSPRARHRARVGGIWPRLWSPRLPGCFQNPLI